MMRLVKSEIGILLVLFVCASRIVSAQSATPASASECLRTVDAHAFEGHVDGPFVTEVGYSKALHTCIVIAVQSFGDGQTFFRHTDIINVSSSKSVWTGMRTVSKAKLKDPYPDLLKKLKELDAETLSTKK
ncbi:MAG: hypothetical protein ABSA48_15830 [Terracidiphilus sp.]|jgi:hypothetical protein